MKILLAWIILVSVFALPCAILVSIIYLVFRNWRKWIDGILALLFLYLVFIVTRWALHVVGIL